MAELRLFLPNWWSSPADLILPTTLDTAPVGPRLSAELAPRAQPVAVARTAPGLAQPLVFADEPAAGLPVSSLADVRLMAGTLPFESSMCGLATLAGGVYGWIGDRTAQLRAAEQIFGDSFVLASLRAFLARTGPRGVIFAEQHIFVLQRLMIEGGADAPRQPLTDVEAAWLSRALLGATALSSPMTDEQDRVGPRQAEWLAFFIQNGAYNRRPMPLGEITRAQELFGRIARSPEFGASVRAYPIEDWMVEDYGLSVDEQFALGFALIAVTRAIADDASRRVLLSALEVDDLMRRLGWADHKAEAALRLVSADRETFKREFAAAGTTPAHISGDVLPFMRHPFLRCADGSVVLLSPRALLSWMSDGFHYRLLDSAQRRAKRANNRKISRGYTALAGALTEEYAVQLVESVHRGRRPIGGGRVYREQPYGRKGSQMTADIAIDLGLDLVLIEVSAARFRAETLLVADGKEAEQDLDRILMRKINQISNCIDALESGVARIPAQELGLEYHRVERVWPVLATASGVTQTPPLWAYIGAKAPNALQQPRVQPLTIIDLEDLELLCRLVEGGHALNKLLAGKTQPQWRNQELAQWLLHDPNAPRGPLGRPQMVRDAFDRAVAEAMGTMDLTSVGDGNLREAA